MFKQSPGGWGSKIVLYGLFIAFIAIAIMGFNENYIIYNRQDLAKYVEEIKEEAVIEYRQEEEVEVIKTVTINATPYYAMTTIILNKYGSTANYKIISSNVDKYSYNAYYTLEYYNLDDIYSYENHNFEKVICDLCKDIKKEWETEGYLDKNVTLFITTGNSEVVYLSCTNGVIDFSKFKKYE